MTWKKAFAFGVVMVCILTGFAVMFVERQDREEECEAWKSCLAEERPNGCPSGEICVTACGKPPEICTQRDGLRSQGLS